MSDTDLPLNYPFTALLGQADLQLALLLAAIDPMLGGVLIEGPRGTAKSTSARALTDVLPSGRFVNLPLGTTEAQLVGTLDLEAVLQSSAVQFRPGLLAAAHGGVLYVDEVNLLADGLVDVLLDVCASGVNRVERDGVSHQHAARITLIGTMNPEEGQLRPQLLDRFGLFVRLSAALDVSLRQRIVRARMAFDADPAAFVAREAAEQNALTQRIASARDALAALDWPDAVHEAVAQRCHAAAVQGVRADIVMLRAARAHAALNGQGAIGLANVQAVAELVLAHRRTVDESAEAGDAGDASQAEASAQHEASEPSQAPDAPRPNATSPSQPESAQSSINPPALDTPPNREASAAQSHEPAHAEADTNWGAMPAPAQATGMRQAKALRPMTLNAGPVAIKA